MERKIGVIGAGNWGKNLVRNFSELGVLSGVAEYSEELRAGMSAEYPSVPLFANHLELIESGVDAVAIATPVPFHFAVAKDALEAGKDVFVEKPLTFSVAEAEELITLAETNKRVLMVGHLLLYQPAIAFVKEFIEAGKLGEIYSMHQERSKLGRVRAAENALWSLGVHDVAVLLHLVGEPVVKTVYSGHCGVQPNIADDTYLHLTFESGIIAHLHNSWLWPENRRCLTIVGEKGMLVYNEVAQNVTFHDKTVDTDLVHHDLGSEVIFSGDGQPLRTELEHFLECLETRDTPLSDGHGGLAVVRVLEAATA